MVRFRNGRLLGLSPLLLVLGTSCSLSTLHVPLQITALRSAKGGTWGGTSFSITGSNLPSDLTISLDGVPCQSVQVSTTAATCVTPPHAEGWVDVQFNSSQGSYTEHSAFQYATDVFTRMDFLAGPAAGVGFADGTLSEARFFNPNGMASDGTNLYVADVYNQTIRKINLASGKVSTLAGSVGQIGSADGVGSAARFYNPQFLDTDGTYVYVSDISNNTIRKVTIATGAVTTLAGTAGLAGTADGTGPAARFSRPTGVAVDQSHTNLYVTDANNCTLRKIVIASGAVTTVVGTAGACGHADGTGAAASLYQPWGLSISGTNAFIADFWNQTIRQVDLGTYAMTTLAGSPGVSGATDATGAAASFYYPDNVLSDGTYVYVADDYNSTVRRIQISSGAVTTIAGSAGLGGNLDGIGSAARLSAPCGLALIGNTLYLVAAGAHSIKAIDLSTQSVTTFAGLVPAAAPGSANGDGTGTDARLGVYDQMVMGNYVYFSDASYNTVRRISLPTGQVTTLAGSAGSSGSADGIGANARFNYPYGITTDGSKIYVSELTNSAIRVLDPTTWQVTTLAGIKGSPGYVDATGTSAQFSSPAGLASDGVYLYVVDSSNQAIRRVTIATGQVITLAGGSAGSNDGTGAAAQFHYARGMTLLGQYLYVADTMNAIIRRIDKSSGEVVTIAGKAGVVGYDNGIGSAARFNQPWSVTNDGTYLYVSDFQNGLIRKIDLATYEVSYAAGTPGYSGDVPGDLSGAYFAYPGAIAFDYRYGLFVASGGGDRWVH